jgi:hypothetical protein
VLLVLLATQLLNSAATITTLGHKQMDAGSQARELFDRMVIDFAQMVKRSDVDYYLKGSPTGNTQLGNDQIAFLSTVPGYYPPVAGTMQQSPVSLVAYRVNTRNRLERMGLGLVWNGVSAPGVATVVFLPLTLSTISQAAVNGTTDSAYYEEMAQQVFRLEYCYVLTDGTRSILPGNISGVAAFVVDIAVIDPRSKLLLRDADLVTFITSGGSNFLADYGPSNMTPGQLRTQWQSTLDGITSLPRPAISGIRLYERVFYLSPPSL